MRFRRRALAAIVVMLGLALGAFAVSSCAQARPVSYAAVCERKPKAKVKPPNRDKCREQCERRNHIADCADQDGNRVPCPCHCP